MSQFPALAPTYGRDLLVFRFRMIFVAILATAGLALTAAPALAGNSPSPSATPTITQQGGGHRHHVRLRPEQWDINLADDLQSGLNVNDVTALGPVRIIGGRDINVSDVLDQLADGNGNDVNLDHVALSLPTIDRRVCEAQISQQDQPWRFNGGTGLFRRATGFGVYNLTADFSFLLNRHGRCTLGNLTPQQVLAVILAGAGGNSASDVQGQIASFCHRHRIPTPTLLADDIFVQGTGVAALPHRISIFTPTASPTETVAAG